MKEKEVKLKFENYLGFDDEGYLECAVFIGDEDKPSIEHRFSMKEIVKEFIDIRSGTKGFDKMFDTQRAAVIKALETSIEALKKAA